MAGEKILDIDDSPTVQRLIEMILTTQGYQVILASDGEEGVAKARAERPAVILVDFVMPKMNGFQVCKALKEDPDFKETPIILVTSKGDKVGSKFVDVLGITEYFTKPFQPEELLAKIREVIDKKAEIPPNPIHTHTPNRDLSPQRELALGSGVQAAQGVIESMVRNIVEQTFNDFIKNTLPEMIHQEIAKTLNEQAPDIQGNLASVPIMEVMQMLGLQRQTGKLVISSIGNAVEVYFKDGFVVFASSHSGGGNVSPIEELLKKSCRLSEDSLRHVLQIAEMTSQPIDNILVQEKLISTKTFADCLRRCTESAVYKIMTWKQGNYYFKHAAAPVFANAIQLKVDDLLMEGARRADEWSLIQQKIPDFNIVLEPMIEDVEELSMRRMSEVDMRVFSLVNGHRTLQEIIDQADLSEFDVAKSIFILLSVNLIKKKP
ncbi:MAG TPA: DUF4388 domain-containing protein [Nitrospirota bacterium]|nr:DUF4388 domain-containing protein [Nitrospirota bacterium]